MEIFSPYEHYVFIFLGLYLFLIIFFLIKSIRLKSIGIQTKADVLSIHIVEHESTDAEGVSTKSFSHKALIEYKTQDEETVKVEIPVAERYLTPKNNKKLPIIYLKNHPNKPTINDDLYIYKLPIVLILILIVFGITFLCILSANGK